MAAPHTFSSSADWEKYAKAHSIPLPSFKAPTPIHQIAPIELDYISSRARQASEHAQWRADHPLSAVGYESSIFNVPVSDGHVLEVKVSYPSAQRMAQRDKDKGESKSKKLPLMFTSFGGGWIQGTHTTEECWLLWPLYPVFDLVVVSVAYRLGPENEAPVWVQDCWDVLSALISRGIPGLETLDADVEIDFDRVILAGSSAGAGIAAALSQRCRDAGINIFGVLLNVPVLCDYRHFARVEKELGVEMKSYGYATEALLPSGAMKWIWETLYPDGEKSLSPDASPLLGDVRGPPRHAIFVAGQDALVDEGVAYGVKLREAGVVVEVMVYEGVPHIFGEFWELEATKRWWRDLRKILGGWLEG